MNENILITDVADYRRFSTILSAALRLCVAIIYEGDANGQPEQQQADGTTALRSQEDHRGAR